MKFAQSTFTSAMEVLKSQAESTQALMQELERQIEKQREAFQKLARESGYVEPMETNMGSLHTPLASYQQALDAAEAATRQGVETFQKAAQQAEKARE
jgi:uncharacterized protein YukE